VYIYSYISCVHICTYIYTYINICVYASESNDAHTNAIRTLNDTTQVTMFIFCVWVLLHVSCSELQRTRNKLSDTKQTPYSLLVVFASCCNYLPVLQCNAVYHTNAQRHDTHEILFICHVCVMLQCVAVLQCTRRTSNDTTHAQYGLFVVFVCCYSVLQCCSVAVCCSVPHPCWTTRHAQQYSSCGVCVLLLYVVCCSVAVCCGAPDTRLTTSRTRNINNKLNPQRCLIQYAQDWSSRILHVPQIHETSCNTQWRKCIRCLQLLVSFRKRTTIYRAFVQKMTYEDKASYASSPTCSMTQSSMLNEQLNPLFSRPPSSTSASRI